MCAKYYIFIYITHKYLSIDKEKCEVRQSMFKQACFAVKLKYILYSCDLKKYLRTINDDQPHDTSEELFFD